MRTRRNTRFLTVAVLVGGLLLAACGSQEVRSDPSSTSTSNTSNRAPSKLVGVDEFAATVARSGVVTINVHIPLDGNIDGTDLTVPYTDIETSKELPADRATPLAVYCRSGNMSAEAVVALQRLGYTDITELDGGYNAWTAAGRTLTAS